MSAQRTQSVRRARRQRDGGFPRACLQGSVPRVGLLRFVLFYLHWGSKTVAYRVCLGVNSVELKDGPKACRFQVTLSHNQLNQGSNPKTARVRGPINQRTSRRGKFRDGSAMRKVLIARGVTPQRPSAPAQPPPHCNSIALRVVTGVGQGFLVVVSFRLWVRCVGLWRCRWKSLPRDPKKGVGGVRDSRDKSPKTSQRLERQSLKKSSRPSQPKAVGRVKVWQILQKVQSPWPVHCGRTSEGFWKSSRTGLSHPARQDKWSLLVKLRNPP